MKKFFFEIIKFQIIIIIIIYIYSHNFVMHVLNKVNFKSKEITIIFSLNY
jgi:hypothetical protein